MSFIVYRTTSTSSRSGGLLTALVRLAIVAASATLVVLALVGFLVVLPLLLLGGIASYRYIRRRPRRAPQRSRRDAIEVEYTIIDK